MGSCCYRVFGEKLTTDWTAHALSTLADVRLAAHQYDLQGAEPAIMPGRFREHWATRQLHVAVCSKRMESGRSKVVVGRGFIARSAGAYPAKELSGHRVHPRRYVRASANGYLFAARLCDSATPPRHALRLTHLTPKRSAGVWILEWDTTGKPAALPRRARPRPTRDTPPPACACVSG
jgi:hypothetical protein